MAKTKSRSFPSKVAAVTVCEQMASDLKWAHLSSQMYLSLCNFTICGIFPPVESTNLSDGAPPGYLLTGLSESANSFSALLQMPRTDSLHILSYICVHICRFTLISLKGESCSCHPSLHHVFIMLCQHYVIGR
jgi:hypothetical protein